MTNISYQDNGLIIRDGITNTELRGEIKRIFTAVKSQPFVIGDLLCFLSRRSAEEIAKKDQGVPYDREKLTIYKTLLDDDKSNKSYLVQCKKTCSHFPIEKRVYPVAYRVYHESVVLTKDSAEAGELLKEATENKWGYRELRRIYRERQAIANGGVNKEKPNAVAEIVKLAHDLARKLSNTFTKQERAEIVHKLAPIVAFVTGHAE